MVDLVLGTVQVSLTKKNFIFFVLITNVGM